jgi:hypothetical protein
MKKQLILIVSLITLSTSVFLAAEENKIPRRIRIISVDEAVPPMIPSILYARFASRIPLVLAGEDELPHNIFTIEYGESLKVSLEDRNGPVDSQVFSGAVAEEASAAATVFDQLAEDWAGFLGLVEPDVSEELEVRREEMEAEVSFEELLNTPFQATLWIPVAARQSLTTDGQDRQNSWLWAWPLRADIAWFFSENMGITGSFRFEYGSQISFGSDSESDPLETTNLMLMPGIGFQVRTLGALAAEFGVTAFFGAVKVTADEPLTKPSLNTGESAWVFYPVLSFEPSVVWSPTPEWSVKFRIIEIQLGLAGMSGSKDSEYGTSESTVILNYFQIGAAYRW